jgi:hypothetical protein
VWWQLKHPYILPFLGVDCITFKGHFSLVSPWISQGTLLDYAKEKSNQPRERLRLVSSFLYMILISFLGYKVFGSSGGSPVPA